MERIDFIAYTSARMPTPAVRSLYRELIDHVPEQFWTAPASFSGRHHVHEGKTDSLVDHTLRAFNFAQHFCDIEMMQPPSRSIVLAAVALHDCQKGYLGWQTTNPDHASIAAQWIREYTCTSTISASIARLVEIHMSWWDGSKIFNASRLNSPANRAIIYADYLASRNDIVINI